MFGGYCSGRAFSGHLLDYSIYSKIHNITNVIYNITNVCEHSLPRVYDRPLVIVIGNCSVDAARCSFSCQQIRQLSAACDRDLYCASRIEDTCKKRLPLCAILY